MSTLSIIIPVYNEEKTLEKIVGKVQKVNLGETNKEIIIVNDGSKDGSEKIILGLCKKYKNITYVKKEKNEGKGSAIRKGLEVARGDFMVIQDGDLEYNPEDFKKMLHLMKEKNADVVYGSRIMGKISGFKIPTHYYGNLLLSFITRLLYGQSITDMETCYKMMRFKVVRSLDLKSNKFDIEPEITAKIIKKGYKIIETPINYNSRSFEEGKKITWRDGLQALTTLLKYRFVN